MTEAEWLGCGNPALMLKFLEGRTSSRKLRLFGCAACRIWHLLPEPSRKAVEIAECYADSLRTTSQLQAVRRAAHTAWLNALTSTCTGPLIQSEEAAARAAYRLTDELVEEATPADAIVEIVSHDLDVNGYGYPGLLLGMATSVEHVNQKLKIPPG